MIMQAISILTLDFLALSIDIKESLILVHTKIKLVCCGGVRDKRKELWKLRKEIEKKDECHR